jgi:hypothetical protein
MTDVVYPEEFDQNIDLFERGHVLKTVSKEAWEIIYDTIHEIVENVDSQHRQLLPGDHRVEASHASLYVLTQFEEHFKNAMKNAMEFASTPPPEFLTYLYKVRDSLDVLKHQEAQLSE